METESSQESTSLNKDVMADLGCQLDSMKADGISGEELPVSDYFVGMSAGHILFYFFDCQLM